MSVKAWQLRLGLFAGVGTLVCVNSLALWGDEAAQRVFVALEVSTGIAALLCGFIVARRMSGISRWWRLLVVGAFVTWLMAELFWLWAREVTGDSSAPWPSVAAYFLPPFFMLAAMLLVAYSGGGVTGVKDDPLRGPRVITVIDGLVATTSFTILVICAGVGGLTGAVLPRSDNAAVVLLYIAIELIVVVPSVLIAMVYRSDALYRANYLLLVGGVVLIASSDRTVAYLLTVGVERAQLWGGIGFVLGPLMIVYSLLERPTLGEPGPSQTVMDWIQLSLPFIGFLGNAVLFAFHVLIGRQLNAALVSAAVVMVLLVAARQVIAVRAQRVVTQRLYEAQRRLAYQVHHDSLTGLPNRVLFAQRLDEAMSDRRFVLIFVDLDDFKEVNDRFGHAAGDELLCAVGERLQRCVRDTDTLARIGGDEFAILIDGEVEEPEVVADRLRVALRDPFAVHGSSVRVRASMGLVRPGVDGLAPTSDDLLRQADISMYAGKRLGKDTAVVYQPASGVLADFPTALREANGGIPHAFSLVYQPIVRLPHAQPVAVEALARWTAPNGIHISPETFVAVAEAAGLGATFDAMVLDLACSEVEAAGVDLDIHVNVGAERLGNPAFEQHVVRTLERHRITPSRLVLEITETVPIVDLAVAASQITRLNALGVKVALDDFGAGYNSLAYLVALPVQIVKLDRDLAVSAELDRNVTLYRSVIGLCDALGFFDVIAEGIESTTQVDTITAAGCCYAQGHLFGRPAPISDLSWASSSSASPTPFR